MVKTPLNYQLIETLDGSTTFFSEKFQEACHSTAGAREETLLHYLTGCKILERKGKLEILEVGFGTGLGFLMTQEILKDRKEYWSFTSLELDSNLVDFFAEKYKALFQSMKNDGKTFIGKSGNFELCILIGDARKTLPQIQNKKWNAIYQDAFSPKKNPDLWTKEWFELLKTHSNLDVIMSTYSSSSSIRKSMVEAGWKLYPGEKFGPKRSSTRAKLTGETDPEILLSLSRSPTPALTDASIKETMQS